MSLHTILSQMDKRLLELGWEIEKLPASEQETRIIIELGEIRKELNAFATRIVEETQKEEVLKTNGILRSAYAIAERNGKDTNWVSFRKILMKELKRQHPIFIETLK